MSWAWMSDAACKGGDLHYDREMEPVVDAKSRETVAKRICDGCRVKSPCLEFALAMRERGGIWGGMTQTERDALERKRVRVAAMRENGEAA